MAKESDILHSVREYLRIQGFFVVRLQQGLGAHKGLPDLLCWKDGIVLCAEIKNEVGRLSIYQEEFKQNVRGKGCFYEVFRSIEDAQKWCQENNLEGQRCLIQ